MRRLQSVLAGTAAAALFAMMVLTFADVFARKFLPNAITGAVELTELLMTVMIYCALPLASMAGEHIVFDLLDRMVPAAVLRWQHRLSHAVTAAVLLGASWLVWERAMRTTQQGDQTAALEIKIAPFQYTSAILLALTAAMHLVLAWRARPSLRDDAR